MFLQYFVWCIYRNYKEKIQKKAHESYQDLAEKAETRMLEYSHKRYNNLSGTEKHRLVEYKKRYYKMKKKKRKICN